MRDEWKFSAEKRRKIKTRDAAGGEELLLRVSV